VNTFTLFHVVLSLVGIGAGFVVVFGLIAAKQLNRWTVAFLSTTVATSLTGFLFPFHKLLPSHVIGVVSLVALAIAILARYGRHLVGAATRRRGSNARPVARAARQWEELRYRGFRRSTIGHRHPEQSGKAYRKNLPPHWAKLTGHAEHCKGVFSSSWSSHHLRRCAA
jgi:hypothetical protein